MPLQEKIYLENEISLLKPISPEKRLMRQLMKMLDPSVTVNGGALLSSVQPNKISQLEMRRRVSESV